VDLRDADHPYYCAESNFYHRRGADQTYESWAEFVEDGGCLFDGDRDMNLLFRWDWNVPDQSDFDDDMGWQNESLDLFFMLQRKGIFLPVTIANVTAEDEPAIREWLAECWKTIQAIWEPVSG
jgi:hypothetical protein